MNSSSVLIVHPSADRFRLSSDMSNGKLGRHYSLDSPSLTSPPGYDPLMDSKAVSIAMSHPNSSVHMGTAHQFSSFNPQFVMAQSGCAPPSLLHISKWRTKAYLSVARLRLDLAMGAVCVACSLLQKGVVICTLLFMVPFSYRRPNDERPWVRRTPRHAVPPSRTPDPSWDDDPATP